MKAFILFIISFTVFAQEPLDKRLILEKLNNGTGTFDWEMIYFDMEGEEESTLKKATSKQKLSYPKFDIDLLRYKYTMDDTYRYSILFDYQNDKCIYFVTKRSVYRATKMCHNHIKKCLNEKKDIDRDKMITCYNESSFCKDRDFSASKKEEIDKNYCEKIYSRKL